MADWSIYVLAVIGAIWVVSGVVWPLVWCALYGTGYLIFSVRAANPGLAKRVGVVNLTLTCVRLWWHGFSEALIRGPVSCVSVGALKWRPLFKYEGFK